MTTFDDRERAYEMKFMLDEELKFRVEARRDRLLGEWAAGRLGLSGIPAAEYVRTVRNEGVVNEGVVHGAEGVFQKVRKDFRDARIGTSDAELHEIMTEFMSTCAREAANA
jgi:hypothetical protein